MAGPSHRYALGISGPDHVADAAAPKVVDDQAFEARGLARIPPCLSEIADRLAFIVENEWTVAELGSRGRNRPYGLWDSGICCGPDRIGSL